MVLQTENLNTSTTSTIVGNVGNLNKNSVEYLYVLALKSFLCRDEESETSYKSDHNFITVNDLKDVNSLGVKVFLDETRLSQSNKVVKNFLEILLYPLSKGVKIDQSRLTYLTESSKEDIETQNLLKELELSKDVLLSFRKFIFAIEQDYFQGTGISTDLDYAEFKEQFLCEPKEKVDNRYKVVAYFLTSVLEQLLIGDLNRQKRNKLKQLIRYINS